MSSFSAILEPLLDLYHLASHFFNMGRCLKNDGADIVFNAPAVKLGDVPLSGCKCRSMLHYSLSQMCYRDVCVWIENICLVLPTCFWCIEKSFNGLPSRPVKGEGLICGPMLTAYRKSSCHTLGLTHSSLHDTPALFLTSFLTLSLILIDSKTTSCWLLACDFQCCLQIAFCLLLWVLLGFM